MTEPKAGPLGAYSDGKIDENDGGDLAIKVSIQKKFVWVDFGTPVTSLMMSPKDATMFAGLLLAKAKLLMIQEADQYGRN